MTPPGILTTPSPPYFSNPLKNNDTLDSDVEVLNRQCVYPVFGKGTRFWREVEEVLDAYLVAGTMEP